jgi:hypothetical protein
MFSFARMVSRRLETDIDRLYQLPLDEFTAARNALARTAGDDAADVRQLVKPSIPAWAVNQLYWKQRELYDALIDASAALRKTHKTILGGRRADLREPSRAHEEALEAALKGALALLQEAGHPATDATRQGVLTTLRALPANEPPGRLTATLQPGGFEMLQGLSIAGSKGAIRAKVEPPRVDSSRGDGGKAGRQKVEVDPELEARRTEAAQARRDAEQAWRREEFESMRATREAEKTAKQLERAREALKNAQQALDEAEATAAAAERDRDAIVRRAKETERALDAARRRHDALTKR